MVRCPLSSAAAANSCCLGVRDAPPERRPFVEVMNGESTEGSLMGEIHAESAQDHHPSQRRAMKVIAVKLATQISTMTKAVTRPLHGSGC